jgi:diaminohydroxyphosphoribosylaminopyrimidine deaminase/5-amino-6-(5-phosphoribosylamino)uracil reductase
MTNVLIEGGNQVLGSLLDGRHVDEVHAFIAPRLLGGQTALTPIGGCGITRLSEALELVTVDVRRLGCDTYLHARREQNL